MPKPQTTPTQRATSSSRKASPKRQSEKPTPELMPQYRPLDEQDEWNERAIEEEERRAFLARKAAYQKAAKQAPPTKG